MIAPLSRFAHEPCTGLRYVVTVE